MAHTGFNMSQHLKTVILSSNRQAYECHNPSFNDMGLHEQIQHGINDWVAEGKSGHPYYGQTKEEAETNRATYND